VGHLQALLCINTSNPPGNELAAAEYLAGVLTREGLSPLVLKSSPTRGNIITRLPGTGEQPPLMLMAHLDVVPAIPEEWAHPPFGGNLIDGVIWGRGALDCKGLVAAGLMTILLSHRLGLPLKGDLVVLAHADEESDFAYGISWLAREHHDLFDAPFALYEGGGEEFKVAGKRVQTVATAEKGWCTVEVTTHGQGGHSSVPHRNNPLFHMAPILSCLRTVKMPIHITDTVAGFFQGLRELFESDEPEKASLFRQMAGPASAEEALQRLPISDSQRIWFDAMLRNTAAPTMMRGSNSRWALPSEARLTLNGRILPGQSAEDYERELRAILGPEIDHRIEELHLGIESEIYTPIYRSIQRVMARQSPDVPVIPVLMTGGTERGLMSELGVQVYGFWPRRLEPGAPSLSQLAHGVDERVSVDNLLYATQCLLDIVCDINGVSSEDWADI